MADNSMIVSIDQKAIIPYEEPNNNNSNKTTRSSLKKRKGSSKNFFKVALFMMRGRSRKSKMLAVDDESKSIWRKLVGSMRPLHLQSNQSPSHDQNNSDDNSNNSNIISHQSMMMITSAPSENGDDGFESASDFTYSPSPSSSRYGSAVGLNEMVQEEENAKNDDNFVNGEGDAMIDAKAEEFIAQFYHQMRLQRLDVMDRHYQEISMRSLGL